jgi:DNA-binding beta-propeller fold protein YncE
MRIGTGDNMYEWIEDWAKTPDTESARTGWSHHGIVVSESGEVYAGHQDDPIVQIFDADGEFLRSWPSDCADTHGLTLVNEGGTEYLWIADNGAKRHPSTAYEYPDTDAKVIGKAVKKTMDGETVLELATPPLAAYGESDYKPTWVAVNEVRNGGNGDIWVTDGYGANLVHRYSSSGEYLSTISGEEGDAGSFDCPHAIFIDVRKGVPELYVADRSNGRVQVYDADGKWLRVFGEDFLTSPSGFVVYGDALVIAELNARITICGADDRPVEYLGDNGAVADVAGWPNNHNEQGESVRTALIEPGKFNSPHGMAVDAQGNLYVAEWLIGGRSIKLAKV